MTIVLILTGCGAAVSDNTTAATNVPSTVSTAFAVTEPKTVLTDAQAPTEIATVPTEPVEDEPRQKGLRLNEEQLAYFEELFNLHYPKPVECYYNLVLNQEFASVQDIDLNAFFEDGSPAYAKYEITDSEREYYAQATGNP